MRLLLILLFSLKLQAFPEIRLEIGEDYLIRRPFSKVWIEHQDKVIVVPKAAKFFIKSLAVGESLIRIDQDLQKVTVMPPGAHQALRLWNQATQHFASIHANECGPYICVSGELFRFADFAKLYALKQPNDTATLFNFKTDPDTQKKITAFYETLLRERGLTPKKIIFGEPWKIYVGPGQKKAYLNLGLFTSETAQKIPELADNVKVSVRILEVNRSFERKLGVRWPGNFQGQVLNNSRYEGPSAFDVAINAAESSGEARILASPNLICRSGQQADFFAGGEIPVKVVNVKSSNVTWKRYGIGLKLKPLVDSVGQMSLQVETEVSSVDRSITVEDLPAFHLSRVSSFFDLINKRTIALSGLIKNEDSQNSEGLPFLKSIPVIGKLFQSSNFLQNKSELIIFVTPELLPQEAE